MRSVPPCRATVENARVSSHRVVSMNRSSFFLSVLFVFLASANLPADVFLLKDAGKIDGILLNPQETPRKTYRISVLDGMEIDIEPKFVERIRRGGREALAEYEAFAPLEENTLENHLRIAQWCRDRQLPDLSRRHLLQVLEFDDDHRDARHLLGHIKAEDGSWTTQQEFLGARGLKKHEGRWKTQQQIDVEQILQRRKKAEVVWEKEITYLRNAWRRDEKARSRFLAIDDPEASGALFHALTMEPDEDTRILLVRALSRIGTLAALNEIARWAIRPSEQVGEVRRACFDELRKHPEALPAIIGTYTAYLHPENEFSTINAAAFALGELEARSAIPHLINALVSHRIEKVKQKSGPVGFGNSGGTGLQWGETVKEVPRTTPNPRVLDALVRMTGVNFQYNKDAWRAWLIESRQTPSFNARRN